VAEEPSLFAELKRRNVYKAAVAYAVVSWLIIQIATQVFPFFEIPNWAVRLVVVLLILGFPAALIFSWAFEITPEGIKRESEIDPGKSISRTTGRKIVSLTMIVAVIASGLLAIQLLRPHPGSRKENGPPVTRDNAGAVSTGLAGAPAYAQDSSAPGRPSIPDKSIAVLPFDNLSDDKSNAYFAEGIQDEILTRLSKIAALKVISRSSTVKYKSAPENLREVGHQLGVANILEGSVQKIANAVHVNVQLIRAATDEHVWAESYNRKLDDVFGVEGEVATAIADQLNAKLTGAEQKAVSDKPTQDAAAYDAYLRALSLEHNEYSYTTISQAADDYAEAVRLDPQFAVAWSRLADARSFLYFNYISPTINTAAAVKEAADRAMAVAPEAGESWIAQGSYRYRVLRQFDSALEAYTEAQKRLPNSSLAIQLIGLVDRRLGRWEEAEKNFKKALNLDPRDVQMLSAMGNEFYVYLRRFDDALSMMDRSLQISPDSPAARANKANILLAAGRLKDAAAELARVPADSTDDWVVSTRILAAMYDRNYDGAIQLARRKLDSIPAGQTLDAFGLSDLINAGYCYSWTKRPDPARDAFTRVLKEMQPTPDAVIPVDANGGPTLPALAAAGLGEKKRAIEQAHRAIKAYETDAVIKPSAEIVLAQVQAQLGEHDAAFAALPHLLEVPAGLTVADLKYNPFWDPLRNDPRFQKLCEEPK
jgi:TolB-like protein/Tfp pilus assembly protein PilF